MEPKGNREAVVLAQQGNGKAGNLDRQDNGEAEAWVRQDNGEAEAWVRQAWERIGKKSLWEGHNKDMGEDVRRLW